MDAGRRIGRAVRWSAVVVTLLLAATSCYKANDFADFNGDHKADLVWMSVDGTWYRGTNPGGPTNDWPSNIALTADATVISPSQGLPYPTGVAGAYDGGPNYAPATLNGPAAAMGPGWHTNGGATIITYAAPDAAAGAGQFLYRIMPVPGMYDGGHKTLPAWYRDVDATWFIQGHDPIQFGAGPSGPLATGGGFGAGVTSYDQDMPVPADYDGDGITDLAVYGPRTGVWKIRSSRTGTVSTTTLGGPGWYPAPGDYDGVHHSQVAALNTSDLPTTRGTWQVQGDAPYVLDAGAVGMVSYPTPADYDGDGKTDYSAMANWGQQSGQAGLPQWHIHRIINGQNADYTVLVPLTPGDYAVQPAEESPAVLDNLARLTLLYTATCKQGGQPVTC